MVTSLSAEYDSTQGALVIAYQGISFNYIQQDLERQIVVGGFAGRGCFKSAGIGGLRCTRV